MDYQFIDSSAELETFCKKAKQAPAIGIDTEFIREKTYYPQLCLVQVAIPESVGIIDPLAIDDISPLGDLLLDPAITKIFHAGRQDQEIFYYLWGKLPAPVFDTQIAASMLGIGDQIGYGKLISTEFGHELDKTLSRTDWSKRPLSEKQLNYAADDVRYLIPLFEKQQSLLEKQDRTDWISSDFEILTNQSTYEPNLENLWKKVKGVQKLRGADLIILKNLCIWRERQAQDRDRPRRHILSDDALIDIARTKPKKQADVERLRSLSPGHAQKLSQKLLEIVEESLSIDKSLWPKPDKRRPLTTEQEAIVDILSATLKLLAKEYAIHPSRVANRSDLQALLENQADAELLHGWKYKHFGRAMQKILQGEQQLQVSQGKILFLDV